MKYAWKSHKITVSPIKWQSTLPPFPWKRRHDMNKFNDDEGRQLFHKTDTESALTYLRIPKNNDRRKSHIWKCGDRWYYLGVWWCSVVFGGKKTHRTHIYSELDQVHLAYVVSVIDYNICLFRTASRSNYAIIDYTKLLKTYKIILREKEISWHKQN
jgi:hypothetical protein